MPTEKEFAAFKRKLIPQVTRLLKELKKDIGADYRASEEDTSPGMQVTIACDDSLTNWTYQTGDNSYSGSCYHYPYWGVIYLYPRSRSRDLAIDGIDDMLSQIHG